LAGRFDAAFLGALAVARVLVAGVLAAAGAFAAGAFDFAAALAGDFVDGCGRAAAADCFAAGFVAAFFLIAIRVAILVRRGPQCNPYYR
jgi:hypothetical protein